jgi:putative phosphoesterase
MKLGLISDTHIPTVAKEIPKEVETAFQGVDMVLHAGDIQVLRALDWLERIAPVYAAEGNNDDGLVDPRIKPVQMLEVEGLTVAVVHVFNYPELPLERFFNGKGDVDVVVYGDTHVPEVIREDGFLRVNPGSPTAPGPNMYLGLGHVAILEIKGGEADAWIVELQGLSDN